MRRSWLTILLAAGLVVLLVFLGALQYTWQTRISESDGEKLHKRLDSQMDAFARDFNREMQNAYFNFQTDGNDWRSSNWNAFNERLDYWRSKTAYPNLIRSFVFFRTDGDTVPLIYRDETRDFRPIEWTDELKGLYSKTKDESKFRPVDTETMTLLLPIHDGNKMVERVLIRKAVKDVPGPIHAPKRYGYLAISLDRDTITQKIIPDLTQKYFPDDEFAISIIGRDSKLIYGGEPLGEDSRARLLDLSPDNFVFFGTKDVMSSIDGSKHDVMLNQRVESRTFTAERDVAPPNGSIKVEVKRDDNARTAIFTTTSTPDTASWTLLARHRDGSIAAFVANTRMRNLAMGFGLLFLLGAAIAAIIYSSYRARRFAQRQVDFVSSVSHEFRTPLAVIYSAGENLADGIANDQTQVSRYGEMIKGEGRKLSGMVEQILEFAGANSGRKRYNFAETDVRQVIEDAIAECRPVLEESNIDLDAEIADALPMINGDKGSLTQAVQNLLLNSIKYRNGNNWVGITAANGDGFVRISVADHGIGIAPKDQRHVFEPFYRSREVVDAQIHGNGLGLAIVRQIAESHGGKVSVRSEPGAGSTFTIALPI